MEKSLVSIIGSKETLDGTLKASGMDTEKMSMEEKYNAYGVMAEFLDETMKTTAENVRDGKTLKELQKNMMTLMNMLMVIQMTFKKELINTIVLKKLGQQQ